MKNTIELIGDIGLFGFFGEGITNDYVKAELSKIEGDEVNINLITYGGDVFEGFSIYNTLKSCNKKINIRIGGICASAGTIISCAGDTIEIAEAAMFMIHNASGGAFGDKNILDKERQILSKIDTIIADVYAKKTGIEKNILLDLMNEETWFTPSEAVKHGFVNKISDNKEFTNKSINTFKAVAMAKPNAFQILLNRMNGVSTPKNMAIKLADDTEVYVFMEEGEDLVGKKIVLADDAGNPTENPAPNGQHTLKGGEVITVEDGVITGVSEPADNKEMEAVLDVLNKLTEKLVAIEAKVNKNSEILNKSIGNAGSGETIPNATQTNTNSKEDINSFLKLAFGRNETKLKKYQNLLNK